MRLGPWRAQGVAGSLRHRGAPRGAQGHERAHRANGRPCAAAGGAARTEGSAAVPHVALEPGTSRTAHGRPRRSRNGGGYVLLSGPSRNRRTRHEGRVQEADCAGGGRSPASRSGQVGSDQCQSLEGISARRRNQGVVGCLKKALGTTSSAFVNSSLVQLQAAASIDWRIASACPILLWDAILPTAPVRLGCLAYSNRLRLANPFRGPATNA